MKSEMVHGRVIGVSNWRHDGVQRRAAVTVSSTWQL